MFIDTYVKGLVKVERRNYRRVVVSLDSCFIIKDNEPGYREFNGVIEDLSECGIKIRVEDQRFAKIAGELSIGDKITFQSIDEFEMFNEMHTEVFSGEAEIVRIDSTSNELVIGCKVFSSSNEFNEYVKNKKMALYMSKCCSGFSA